VTAIYAHAQITALASIKRAHKLPRGSMPRVLAGQNVKANEVLAVAEVAHEHRILNIAKTLGVEPRRIISFLVKREGDIVSAGDLIAARRKFLRKIRVTSPIDGSIIHIEEGQMLIEGKRTRIEVEATIPGKVVNIEAEKYIEIETSGALIQIAWGYGDFVWGTLKVMDGEPSLNTNADRFNIDHRGAIVAIGSPLTEEFLANAIETRVKGVIASSMRASLIPKLEGVEFPIGLTQGFGQLPMSDRIMNLLKTYNGREIALDIGDHDDWRNKRPEIIIPLVSSQEQAALEEHPGKLQLAKGQKVRIMQTPYWGEIGTITEIIGEPLQLASGLWSKGVNVETADGSTVFVPFANLEHLG
jgi:hypothetical protein